MLNRDGSEIPSSMFVYEYGWHLFQVEWKEMSNLEVWVKDTSPKFSWAGMFVTGACHVTVFRLTPVSGEVLRSCNRSVKLLGHFIFETRRLRITMFSQLSSLSLWTLLYYLQLTQLTVCKLYTLYRIQVPQIVRFCIGKFDLSTTVSASIDLYVYNTKIFS